MAYKDKVMLKLAELSYGAAILAASGLISDDKLSDVGKVIRVMGECAGLSDADFERLGNQAEALIDERVPDDD